MYTCKKCGEELILDDVAEWDELACPECSEVLPPEAWENMKIQTEKKEV